MKRKIIVLLLIIAVFFSVISLPVSAAQAEGMDFAYRVKGGTVNSVDDLIKAFTDIRPGKEDKVYAKKVEGKENTVELTESVILNAPIMIYSGTYKLHGRHSTIYRGFAGTGSMIMLMGIDEKSAGLILENEGEGEWTNPFLTLDGNADDIPNAPGGLISVSGRATLTVNKGVVFTNSSTATYGGAIFAEIGETGTERTPLIPTVNLNNCRIENCYAGMGGGAVGLLGYYSGTNGGTVSMKNVTLKGNHSDGGEVNGMGGAIYAEGGEVKLDGVTAENNKAHNGGVLYTLSDTSVKNCTFQYNEALIDGGAIYCAVKEGLSGSVTVTDCIVNYNTAAFNGGAVVNNGFLTLKDMTLLMNNEAKGNGGGVYNTGSFTLEGASLTTNTAGGIGGAVCSVGTKAQIKMKDGEMGNNSASFCSALYSEGDFEMLGGAIGNNKGDAPHILLRSDLLIGGSAFVQNDTIGLCVTETDDGKFYPCIIIDSKMTATVKQSVGYYSERLDDDGNLKGLKKATRNGLFVVLGNNAEVARADEIFEMKSRGLLSYKLTDEGVTSVRFIFLPVWAWMIILAAAVTALCVIFRKQIVRLVMCIRQRIAPVKVKK